MPLAPPGRSDDDPGFPDTRPSPRRCIADRFRRVRRDQSELAAVAGFGSVVGILGSVTSRPPNRSDRSTGMHLRADRASSEHRAQPPIPGQPETSHRRVASRTHYGGSAGDRRRSPAASTPIRSKRTRRAPVFTDASCQPAFRHTRHAGHACHPSGSVHHAVDVAASGSPRLGSSRTLSKGSVHEPPATPPGTRAASRVRRAPCAVGHQSRLRRGHDRRFGRGVQMRVGCRAKRGFGVDGLEQRHRSIPQSIRPCVTPCISRFRVPNVIHCLAWEGRQRLARDRTPFQRAALFARHAADRSPFQRQRDRPHQEAPAACRWWTGGAGARQLADRRRTDRRMRAEARPRAGRRPPQCRRPDLVFPSLKPEERQADCPRRPVPAGPAPTTVKRFRFCQARRQGSVSCAHDMGAGQSNPCGAAEPGPRREVVRRPG